MNTIGAATDRVRNCGLSVGSRGGVVGSGPAARCCLFQLSMWPQRQEFNFGELTQQEIIPALEGVAVCHSMSQVATQLAEKYLKWCLFISFLGLCRCTVSRLGHSSILLQLYLQRRLSIRLDKRPSAGQAPIEDVKICELVLDVFLCTRFFLAKIDCGWNRHITTTNKSICLTCHSFTCGSLNVFASDFNWMNHSPGLQRRQIRFATASVWHGFWWFLCLNKLQTWGIPQETSWDSWYLENLAYSWWKDRDEQFLCGGSQVDMWQHSLHHLHSTVLHVCAWNYNKRYRVASHSKTKFQYSLIHGFILSFRITYLNQAKHSLAEHSTRFDSALAKNKAQMEATPELKSAGDTLRPWIRGFLDEENVDMTVEFDCLMFDPLWCVCV